MIRREQPQNLSLPISKNLCKGLKHSAARPAAEWREAECFQPFHRFMSVELVRKIEIQVGLECDQQLLRKLIITMTGANYYDRY
jgi:hypothetical protein